jgi:hypothetical protein
MEEISMPDGARKSALPPRSSKDEKPERTFKLHLRSARDGSVSIFSEPMGSHWASRKAWRLLGKVQAGPKGPQLVVKKVELMDQAVAAAKEMVSASPRLSELSQDLVNESQEE